MERTWCKGGPAADLLIKGGRVVDPEAGLDAVQDVLVTKGKVAELGKDLKPGKNTRVVDARDMLVLPGFVDLHAHLRTPGREDEEDIATGSRAAAAGGYVAIFAMANTDPVVDTASPLSSSPRWASWARPARSASATTDVLWPPPRSRAAPSSTSR
jgi:dihydroorotase